ncbi:MAG TPA: cobalamin biosynthesis protein CbiD [Clostridiaceae bacterium]|nr:cobalamin biosynthesis protein CbiD [Clostridiaceae bacterium]
MDKVRSIGSDPIIELQKIVFAYPDQEPVLRNISLKIDSGEVIVLLGPNGSGKSTLFRVLTGLLKPQEGRFLFRGEPLSYQSKRLNQLRQCVGMVFQDPDNQLFASTVEQEISFGAVNLRLPPSEVRRRTEQAIADTDLTDLATKAVQYLSFGQKKRVSVADLLVMESELLLLDEPTAWLDPPNAQLVTNILDELSKRGISLLIATHDVNWAYSFGERMILLREGSIQFDGDIVAGFNNAPLLRKASLPRPMIQAVCDTLQDETMANDGPVPRDFATFEKWMERRKIRQNRLRASFDADDDEVPEQEEKDRKNNMLRKGFTTGSCAAVAALASTLLWSGKSLPEPPFLKVHNMAGKPIVLPVDSAERQADGFWQCAVIKDGGDDPDVTTGLSICATVRPNDRKDEILFERGEGVGVVTLPGLKIEPGEPAINPVPRGMIREALRPYLPETGGLTVRISVPGGEEIAAKTFNPRLGIEGGLSILGTTGIVEPMSEKAYIDSLVEEVHVAAAIPDHGGKITLVFGNTSERFANTYLAGSMGKTVMCSNFVGPLLRAAAAQGLKRVTLVGPLGKIIKVSAGIFNTHSHVADARAEILVANAALLGVSGRDLERLAECRTTDAALPILEDLGIKEAFCERIARRTCEAIEVFEHLELQAECLLSDGRGRFLYSTIDLLEEIDGGELDMI